MPRSVQESICFLAGLYQRRSSRVTNETFRDSLWKDALHSLLDLCLVLLKSCGEMKHLPPRPDCFGWTQKRKPKKKNLTKIWESQVRQKKNDHAYEKYSWEKRSLRFWEMILFRGRKTTTFQVGRWTRKVEIPCRDKLVGKTAGSWSESLSRHCIIDSISVGTTRGYLERSHSYRIIPEKARPLRRS